jgi:hypothetical protein
LSSDIETSATTIWIARDPGRPAGQRRLLLAQHLAQHLPGDPEQQHAAGEGQPDDLQKFGRHHGKEDA